MAFTLKKHTSNQLESARLNDVNQNWTDIETAIDALQTNASLLVQSKPSSAAASVEAYFDDLLQNNPSSIPNRAISFRDVSIAGYRWVMTIYRRDNQLFIHAFTSSRARYYYRSTSGTWSVKQVTLTTL